MSNQELQQDEIEALQAIYPEEFTLVSNEPNARRYEITIPLIPTDSFDEDDTEQLDAIPHLTMHISIPENYPQDESPDFSLQSLQLKREVVADVSDALKEACEENQGDVVIFTLIQRAQDWYEEYAEQQEADKLDQQNDMSNLNRHMTDEEARFTASSGFVGTPVSKDNFLEWKTKFDAEMEQKRNDEHEKRMNKGAKLYGTMSGREYFEQKDQQWIQDIQQNQSETQEPPKATEEHIDEDLFLDDDEDED